MTRSFINLGLCFVIMVCSILGTLGCETGPKAGSGTTTPPTMRNLSDPLASALVEISVMMEAAIENALVQLHGKAAKKDITEAGTNIEAVRAQFQKQLEAKDAEIAAAIERAEEAESKSHAWYIKTQDMLKIAASVFIALGIVASVWLSKKWLVVSAAAGTLLLTLLLTAATEEFFDLYGLKIVCGIAIVASVMVLYVLWTRVRATKDLYATGKVMREKLAEVGVDWKTQVAPEINQHPVTKWLVNLYQARDRRGEDKNQPSLPMP
jgi:hypothetical protein